MPGTVNAFGSFFTFTTMTSPHPGPDHDESMQAANAGWDELWGEPPPHPSASHLTPFGLISRPFSGGTLILLGVKEL